jgi:hypothetical protein
LKIFFEKNKRESEKIVFENKKIAFEKIKKNFLPLVHHSFEVKCCCCQHNIDVIAECSFVKIAV